MKNVSPGCVEIKQPKETEETNELWKCCSSLICQNLVGTIFWAERTTDDGICQRINQPNKTRVEEGTQPTGVESETYYESSTCCSVHHIPQHQQRHRVRRRLSSFVWWPSATYKDHQAYRVGTLRKEEGSTSSCVVSTTCLLYVELPP
jgi:hypothetical protein